MDVRARERAKRSSADAERLARLSAAVYPPDDGASWPGRDIEWSEPEWDIEVVDETGEIVSYAGVVLREGRHDDEQVLIGGVGGVKTHPRFRRSGYAGLGLRRTHQLMIQLGADFGLLVCDESLIPYYERQGWLVFPGVLMTDQRGEKVRFEFNTPMVRPVITQAPPSGTIDLMGPPW